MKTDKVNAVNTIRQTPATYHSAELAVESAMSASARKRKMSESMAKKPSTAVTVADNLSLLMTNDFCDSESAKATNKII